MRGKNTCTQRLQVVPCPSPATTLTIPEDLTTHKSFLHMRLVVQCNPFHCSDSAAPTNSGGRNWMRWMNVLVPMHTKSSTSQFCDRKTVEAHNARQPRRAAPLLCVCCVNGNRALRGSCNNAPLIFSHGAFSLHPMRAPQISRDAGHQQ